MESSHSSTNSAQLAPFLRSLADTGEVAVVPWKKGSAALDSSGAEPILRELDAAAREELSGTVPALDLPAALWAARQLYRLCQVILCRDVPAEELPGLLDTPCPSSRGPAADFSVDVLFRHLPGLHGLARRLAPGDALVATLNRWAAQWPLSSVGIVLDSTNAGAVKPSLDSFLSDAVLRRLYLDRIAAHGADDRLVEPCVRAALAADFGAHPSLAPALHAALQRASAPPAAIATS